MNLVLFMIAGKLKIWTLILLNLTALIKHEIKIFQGYETTSTTLGYASFVLAKHPEEQQKLFEEISSHFSNDSKASSVKN
jgi:hypothetical protein